MDNLPWIFISALLVNNFVLTYFLGLCPFLGVSNSLQTSARLGLATTYATVTQSGGAVTADSEPGHGAAFHIWLPLAPAPTALRSRTVPDRPAGDADTGGHLALIVDDDGEARQALADELARLGCETITVAGGEEALAHLDAPIDLLLTDLELPDIGGEEVARRFLEHRPDLSVVYATGAPVIRVRTALPDDAIVLRKPFTTAELVAAVREHRWAMEGAGGAQSAGTNR